MSDIVRSGDEDEDMGRWMERTAAMLARLLVETEFGPCDADQEPTSTEREGTQD